MEKCKVEFIEDGQKMIVDFTLENEDTLNYTVSLEPKEYDPKKDYGLSGKLFTMFMDTLVAQTTEIPEEAEVSDMTVNGTTPDVITDPDPIIVDGTDTTEAN